MAAVEILRHVLRHNKTLNSSVMFLQCCVQSKDGQIMWDDYVGFPFLKTSDTTPAYNRIKFIALQGRVNLFIDK